MKIASGIEMLEITANLTMGPGVLYPTLIWDQEEAILVDTGLPGQLLQIEEAMKKQMCQYQAAKNNHYPS